MTDNSCHIEAAGIERAIESLIDQLLQLKSAPSGKMIRIEVPVDGIDPLAWIAHQPFSTKVYWRNRNGQAEAAGVGVADSLFVGDEKPASSVTDKLHGLTRTIESAPSGMRYFGGLRFNHSDPATCAESMWASFGKLWFCLPRIEVVREGNSVRLACNILPNDQTDETIDKVISDLRRSVVAGSRMIDPQSNCEIISRHDFPQRKGWDGAVRNALDLFASGGVRKIVLARKSEFSFGNKLNGWALLERLRNRSVDSHLFGFQPQDGRIFVGATPERLYRRQQDKVESEALAGTRRRGSSPEEDRQMERDLLHSEKDMREHEFVANAMQESLDDLCSSPVKLSDLEVRKLAHVQHLCREYTGILREGINDADLLTRLHPTPAVNGTPTDRARREIGRLEPFDRGWYAGPVGWISRESAEFAVAIRSGLIRGDKLALYSGAGIVDGSTPENEWEEIEAKIGNFMKAVSSQ